MIFSYYLFQAAGWDLNNAMSLYIDNSSSSSSAETIVHQPPYSDYSAAAIPPRRERPSFHSMQRSVQSNESIDRIRRKVIRKTANEFSSSSISIPAGGEGDDTAVPSNGSDAASNESETAAKLAGDSIVDLIEAPVIEHTALEGDRDAQRNHHRRRIERLMARMISSHGFIGGGEDEDDNENDDDDVYNMDEDYLNMVGYTPHNARKKGNFKTLRYS